MNVDIPRPFVVKPPLTEQTIYGTTESLVFDLVVVGSAIDYLPYFTVAFRELGVTGFGLNRARVHLERVEAVFPSATPTVVYESESNLVRHLPAEMRSRSCRPDEEGTESPA